MGRSGADIRPKLRLLKVMVNSRFDYHKDYIEGDKQMKMSAAQSALLTFAFGSLLALGATGAASSAPTELSTTGISGSGVLTKRLPNGDVIRYTLNGSQRLTSLLLPDGSLHVFQREGEHLAVPNAAGKVSTYMLKNERVSRIERSDGVIAEFSYDTSNRLAEITQTNANGPTTFQLDANGILRDALLPNGDLIEYGVDQSGRRVSKKINGRLMQRFAYDAQSRISAELGGRGNVVSSFVYGSKRNVPDSIIKNGRKYRVISDAMGSVHQVLDAASNSEVQRVEYDEFGNETLDTNPGFQPFGFAGGLFDVETGAIHVASKDYFPQARTVTSRSPDGPADPAGNNVILIGHEMVVVGATLNALIVGKAWYAATLEPELAPEIWDAAFFTMLGPSVLVVVGVLAEGVGATMNYVSGNPVGYEQSIANNPEGFAVSTAFTVLYDEGPFASAAHNALDPTVNTVLETVFPYAVGPVYTVEVIVYDETGIGGGGGGGGGCYKSPACNMPGLHPPGQCCD